MEELLFIRLHEDVLARLTENYGTSSATSSGTEFSLDRRRSSDDSRLLPAEGPQRPAAGYAVESRLRHYSRRFREVRRLMRSWVSLALEMEELWLQTRKRSDAEVRLLAEIERLRHEVNRNLRAAELQLAHVRARIHSPELRVPSRLALAFRNVNFRMAKRITCSRADLEAFWNRSCRPTMLLIRPDKVIVNLLRDLQLFLLFVRDLARA